MLISKRINLNHLKKNISIFFLFFLLIIKIETFSQKISDFVGVASGIQDASFHFPTTHKFQIIVKKGDTITIGASMPDNFDFTGYVPINGRSDSGYLSINSELTSGGVTIMNLSFDSILGKWQRTQTKKVDFTSVQGTTRNCSGAVTPWNTIITCEEAVSGDGNSDGYYDLGWNIEINPVTRNIVNHPGGLSTADKLWALGNMKHENITVLPNNRTVYQGSDDNPGYLFKFIADSAKKLYAGKLYVYKGSKSGKGRWIKLDNSTASKCNTIISQCADSSATIFNGIEDVEYNPKDSFVYLAVKNENRVYRFKDTGWLKGDSVVLFETHVGNATYSVTHSGGTSSVAWGTGNDNLAFDSDGNLWVLQDGDNNYIWFVEKTHTQASPKVRIFGRIPAGAEPTGITFTPNFKFMFISFQHPSSGNSSATQTDAFGNKVTFNDDVALVISREEYIGLPLKFIELGVNCKDFSNSIFWQVNNESNLAPFKLERSTSFTSWEEIYEITNPFKNVLYQFEDFNFDKQNSINYYRVKTFLNNQFEYSNQVACNNQFLKNYSIINNPAQNILKIHANMNFKNIEIINSLGQKVDVLYTFQNNQISIDINALTKGFYFILIDNYREMFVVNQ